MPFLAGIKNTGKPVDQITQGPVYATPVRRYNFAETLNHQV
jgi:hypothetical protein